ncbi:endo-1,4-beta-xylanase [Paenibacillus macerans]|uniref:endo-1,4-beta-xylanase n=1 Tax=Paenibacillus macerans TaxID=44252 RepID=UPI002DBF00BA|nr:endo-1,4-beta-xylanase [Paenibacillus macerans]MEC0331698.1 endo-1,4-beta-xylanase [Paenibacillus macerans]
MRKRLLRKVLSLFWILSLVGAYFSAQPDAQAANTVLVQSDFEDGTAQGWTGRSSEETLTAAAEAARSGAYGLKVADRSMGWHGVTLDVTAQMELGKTYVFSGWIKLPAGSPDSRVYMTMQRTAGSDAHYEQIANGTASASRWLELRAEYKYREPGDQLSIYFEIPDQPTLSFYLDDFALERLPDSDPIVIEYGIPSLKDVFAGDFLFGAAFENSELYQEPDKQLLAKHFNSVTPGNVLKWDSTEPEEGQFRFAGADAAVQFALDNGQQVRGHALVWHNQTPDWVFRDENGNLVSKDVLFQRMENHIKTVMGRYKDAIYAWDVVNEVIDPSQPDGLRRSLWYQIAGEEYIEKAFIYAHEADPDAVLFINDYNTHEPAKSQALYNLVKRLQEKGIPVHGVGHQTHINIDWPQMSEIENSILKFAELGLKTEITELDIDVYTNTNQRYDTLPDSIAQKQVTRYKQLFDIFRKHSDLIDNVTVWGKDDGNSWLRKYPVNRNNWPLLFDERLQSKPAYWAIVDAAQPQVPAVPANVKAAAGDQRVTLSWDAANGASGYHVKRAEQSGGPYVTVAQGVTAAVYSDAGLVNGKTYYYVISAVNNVGESRNSAEVNATPRETPTPEPGEFAVQYRSADSNAGDNHLKPHFRIVNQSEEAVPLSELTLRYWYTIDGDKPQQFHCDYAQIGGSNISGSLVKLDEARSGADYYLELSFSPAAGSIAAGGNSGEIQTRINKTDWTNYNERDDYSYDGSKTSFTDWDRVTLYRNGTLVWGIEPGM